MRVCAAGLWREEKEKIREREGAKRFSNMTIASRSRGNYKDFAAKGCLNLRGRAEMRGEG